MKTYKRVIAYFIALSISGMIVFTASAHPQWTGIVVGNNSNGWMLFPSGSHLNGTSFSYRIEIIHTQMTPAVINNIQNAATSWSPTISINRVQSGGLGKIEFTNANNPIFGDNTTVAITETNSNSNTLHRTSFDMWLREGRTIT
jgi:hypothetical protein